MDAATFHTLPRPEVARLVRAAGPKVCVFPINGTRRWFMLEHAPPSGQAEDQDLLSQAYLDTMKDSIAHLSSYCLHPEVPVQEQRQLVQLSTDGIWLGQKSVKQALDDAQFALQRQLDMIRSPAKERSPAAFLIALAVLLIVGIPLGIHMRRMKTAKEAQ